MSAFSLNNNNNNSLKLDSKMECRVVLVGDAKVGKTSLIKRFTDDEFHENYTPTSFDKVKTLQEVNKHQIDFVLWDTSGSPSYDSVRSLSYSDADVFLLCFKLSDPISLYNVKNKWAGDLRKHCPNAPIILCGCQSDMQTDLDTMKQLAKLGRSPVTSEQALAICCEIEAENYVETSSSSSNNERDVSEAFELCALAAIKSGRISTSGSVSGTHSGKSSVLNNRRLSSGSNNSNKNVSFGSQASDICNSGKRSLSSSLKKSCNASFSGSECDQLPVKSRSVIHEDDLEEDSEVFRNPSKLNCIPISPKCRNVNSKRSSVALVKFAEQSNFQDFNCNPLSDCPPLGSSTVQKPNRSSSVFVSDNQMPSAQVRPNGLSRRTSFRTSGQQPQKLSIPVATPKSPEQLPNHDRPPVLSEVISQVPPPPPEPVVQIFDLKSATYVGTSSSPGAKFESLKSHGSTGSTASSSKTSTRSSVTSNSKSSLSKFTPKEVLDPPDVPDTEDPELLKQLQFVSPKSGVFRPVNSGAGTTSKKKQSCCVM